MKKLTLISAFYGLAVMVQMNGRDPAKASFRDRAESLFSGQYQNQPQIPSEISIEQDCSQAFLEYYRRASQYQGLVTLAQGVQYVTCQEKHDKEFIKNAKEMQALAKEMQALAEKTRNLMDEQKTPQESLLKAWERAMREEVLRKEIDDAEQRLEFRRA